jgi:hypothetical protein
MGKIVDQVKEIINNADDQVKEHFEDNFFVMSHEGLTNLNELLADLEWAKMYLNEMKRRSKS